MQTLEILYETQHKNALFVDRKLTITHKKVLLCGPRKSGKTHLIFDHLSHYEKGSYLYIDFSDTRVERATIAEHLSLFLVSHPIVLLVLEHFDFSFEVPQVAEIIITTTLSEKSLNGFVKQTLYPLDFEEFIAFDKKHSNIEHLFNLFANHGTFPHINQLFELDYHRQMQAMLQIILPESTVFAIYKRFCELQSTKITLFQIYNQLKSTMKLSKDKLYTITTHLVENNLLFFVQKYNQPNVAKKVYAIDFALKNALTFKKDFLKRFENMIFLELLKREKEIYYDEGIDFYLPKEKTALFCIAFGTEEAIQSRMKKLMPSLLALDVHKVDIISLGNEGSFEIDSVNFTLSPFWEWSLQL
ncbi:MAG: ATP-binding protein [Sulfurospirillaceae bacterium]|nr:ATP-binding protein [Sulfurospirillaceae bacterium]